MVTPGQQSFLELIGGVSLFGLFLLIARAVLNAVLARWIGDRVIDRWLLKLKRWVKAHRTKYKKIKADLEFTGYLNPDCTVGEAHQGIESAIQNSIDQSKRSAAIDEFYWLDETTAEVTVTYLNNDPFTITIDLIQENRSFGKRSINTVADSQLSSIGVTVRFEFDFYNLKGALMDVGTFSQFLREGLKQEFSVRNVTESRFKVGTLENDLTMDEWIQEQRFEASLLLKDERGERSIEFQGNQAVITAPYPEVDDQTAEYIRLTLLNYYL